MTSSDFDTFETVQSRLDEIVDAVGDDSLPLDDALALYEEAVNLGLRASDLLEENIEAYDNRQADTAEGQSSSDEFGASAEAGSASVQGDAETQAVPDNGGTVQTDSDQAR